MGEEKKEKKEICIQRREEGQNGNKLRGLERLHVRKREQGMETEIHRDILRTKEKERERDP